MKWKLFGCVLAVYLLSFRVAAAVLDPFATRPAAAYDTVQSVVVPVVDGEILELSAYDLELRLGIAGGTLEGITVTALPRAEEGVLLLDGVEVEAYEYLARSEVDRLLFVPYEKASGARFCLLPHTPALSAAANLNIRVLSQKNDAPVLDSLNVQTVRNVSAMGYFNAMDPDGDDITVRMLQGPKKGSVTVNGATFVYQPFYDMSGDDSFVVCAVDSVGNYSEPATVQVYIEGNKSGFQYADMLTNPSHYAAIKLQEAGVLTGERIGGSYLFFPDRVMQRGDFILLLVEAAGVPVSPTVNSGLPNDGELPLWFKPYAKAAVEAGILPEGRAFQYNEVPTRAEAVVLVNRASGISDVKRYSLWMPDAASIPDWAESSYMNLAAYRMLDLYDNGNALPNKALSNSDAADLIWQLYKLKQAQ